MTHRPEPLATAQAGDALVRQMTAYEHLFTPALLRRYLAKVISHCLEQACVSSGAPDSIVARPSATGSMSE